MAISFDTVRKHIVLDSSNESWSVIWSRWCDWHKDNRQWPLAFKLVGGISLGGGLYIPPYFFLLNGWRVRPMEANHDLVLTGNGFVDGGGVPVTNTLGVFRVNVNYTVPVQAQGISTSGGSSEAPSADVIASEVLARLASHLAKIEEAHRLLGLDAASPVVVTDTSRSTAGISQTFEDDGTSTTIRRA